MIKCGRRHIAHHFDEHAIFGARLPYRACPKQRTHQHQQHDRTPRRVARSATIWHELGSHQLEDSMRSSSARCRGPVADNTA